MGGLPEDVIMDIFIYLPVISLLRFRCVSKHFLALIDSPYFIKRHLNHSLQTNTNHKLILLGGPYTYPPSGGHLYSVDLDEVDQAVEMDYYPRGTEIIGSVNGLLCLSYGDEEDILFWNFATRGCHKLPPSGIDFSGQPSPRHATTYYSYGLGYDSVSDDYKLLRMVQLIHSMDVYDDDESILNTEAQVYSLTSNSWQRIQELPYYIDYGSYGQQVCNALHWVVSCTSNYPTTLIAAFDLATNGFKVIDHPEVLEMPHDIANLGGLLCVLDFPSDERRLDLDLWIMKDYGVKESWSKLYSVSQPELMSSSKYVVPLTYSRSGTEILLCYDDVKLLWYSLKEEKVRMISPRGCPDVFELQVCVESLVSLSSKADYYDKEKDGECLKEKLIVKKRNDFKLKL